MFPSRARVFSTASSLVLASLLCHTPSTWAAALDVRIGNTVIRKEVKSVLDLRYRNVVRQNTDYSCGAAALATLLSYYFGEQTTEEGILNTVLSDADEETLQRIMTSGLSLLDLKKYAEALGFRGKGYRLDREALKKLDRPAIGLITIKGYNHFVVITAIDGEKVFIADPAKGNTVSTLGDFMGMWNRIVLVFENRDEHRIESHGLVTGTPFGGKKIDILNSNRIDLGFALDSTEF